MSIKSFGEWETNAELIADAATLWMSQEDTVLDCTYGLGNFWTEFRPKLLVASDLHPCGPGVIKADFTKLPFADKSFSHVIYDPPYKLNGTDQGEGARYGVDKKMRWQDRIELMRLGLIESARVADEMVWLKCQNQVCSGKVRWQSFYAWDWAKELGLVLEDMFDFPGGREQPRGRKQVHARRNTSQLMLWRVT